MKAILDVRVVKRINIGKYAQIVTAGSEPGFAGSQSHIECPLVLYISTSVWVLRIPNGGRNRFFAPKTCENI